MPDKSLKITIANIFAKIRELKDTFLKIKITTKLKIKIQQISLTAEKGVGREEGPVEERQPESFRERGL